MALFRNLPRSNTKPELFVRSLLTEMGLRITNSNEPVIIPFREWPLFPDFVVEDLLVIEVQSHKFHDKKRRHQKDLVKRECFESMGFGVLWLWDDELRWAKQKKRGIIWKPYVKEMITKMLSYAKTLRWAWESYQADSPVIPKVKHPEYGIVDIRRRNE